MASPRRSPQSSDLKPNPPGPHPKRKSSGVGAFIWGMIVCASGLGMVYWLENRGDLPTFFFGPPTELSNGFKSPPLAMEGGDPHLRALLRTISASESNDQRPYAVIYGGSYLSDFSDHPRRCITITAGPNRGNCSTAAGRYQMLDITWVDKAKRYHPNADSWLWWSGYSFEPRYQDEVVYRWLSDRQAWGFDIAALLKQNQLNTVLKRLSGTWTSLGYGIEDNVMTPKLPIIYRELLDEELKRLQDSN
ncbi:MAG: glycoside hydrolase family protein [Cyanobacteria bacterium P01_H01_bin.130]